MRVVYESVVDWLEALGAFAVGLLKYLAFALAFGFTYLLFLGLLSVLFG